MTPELRFILEGAVALVALAVVLLHHRRAMTRVLREAEDHRRATPVPQVTVLPAQVTVLPAPAPVKLPPSPVSALKSLPPPPTMPEHEVCSLCCAAVLATRERAACHSVPFTPDQVRKAALQMAHRMAKGPLPADIETRIRKELAGPAAAREADHG